MGDLNPCFEETTALLVTPDEVKSDEELAVMLWDSDKRSAEFSLVIIPSPRYLLLHSDLIGRIEIPVKDLIQVPNKTFYRTDHLIGFEDADSMPGSLS